MNPVNPVFYYALGAFAGTMITAYLGWVDAAPEPFDWRKFSKSVVCGLVAAFLWAVIQFVPTSNELLNLAIAVSTGMSLDVSVNRLLGAVSAVTSNKNISSGDTPPVTTVTRTDNPK